MSNRILWEFFAIAGAVGLVWLWGYEVAIFVLAVLLYVTQLRDRSDRAEEGT